MIKRLCSIFIITAAILTAAGAFAQDAGSNRVSSILDSVQKNKEQDLAATGVDQSVYRMLQERNRVILLVSIIVMTPVFMFLVLFYIKQSNHYTAEHIVNGSALVLVIQATTFIVIAAPTSEQLTAAIGVLGAIAGYLFGTSTKRREKEGA